MYPEDRHTPLEPADATMITYTMLRHLGLMLDELSAQGLTLWQDERRAWRWTWASTTLQAERGFWALGEAIVDAVVVRYPAAFDITSIMEDALVSAQSLAQQLETLVYSSTYLAFYPRRSLGVTHNP